MSKIPSPCIDVCKYKLKGHCIGCSMTKAQKSAYKKLSGAKPRKRFIAMVVQQQEMLGGRFKGWGIAYRRRCIKKGVPCPLDDLKTAG
ncbi:MAG: DUF1289 domain-containing protein [Pseudomonadota bacterium]